jgi:hypothetical protein
LNSIFPEKILNKIPVDDTYKRLNGIKQWEE